MSELKELVVVSVEQDLEKGIAHTLQLAEPDYSAIYDLKLYKKTYNKEENTWNETEDSLAQFMENMAILGIAEESELDTLEDTTVKLWVDESTGRLYFKEGTIFIKIEKPALSLKRLKKAPIVAIKDSPKGRAVVVENEGTHYAFNFNTGVWVEKIGKFIPNQAQLAKRRAAFNELFEEVDITWDNAEELIGLAFESGKPFVVDCVVNKNALDPKSNVGWLEGQALDADDNKDAMNVVTKHFSTVEDSLSEDDLPF